MNKYNLTQWSNALLKDEPFLCSISRQITKRPSEAIPTAGIKFNEKTKTFELIYNPEFLASLDGGDEWSMKDKKLLIKHEMFHAVLGHVSKRLPSEGMTKLWNIATDLAINGMIFRNEEGEITYYTGEGPKLYEMGVFPGKKPFESYPPGLSSEEYFQRLKQDKKLSEEFVKEYEFDVHEGFGCEGGDVHGAEGLASENLKEIIKEAVREADRPGSRGWGNVSSSMKEELRKLANGTVNWRSALRYFVNISQRNSRKSTPTKINHRHPFTFPGTKANRTSNVAVAIDQSGSVSNAMLEKFFAELNKLSKICTFTVIPFDTSVQHEHVFVWKKNQELSPIRYKYGGTDFNAPTKYVNENGSFDGLIVLTDMEAPKPITCKVKRMWITTESCSSRRVFNTTEKVVKISD